MGASTDVGTTKGRDTGNERPCSFLVQIAVFLTVASAVRATVVLEIRGRVRVLYPAAATNVIKIGPGWVSEFSLRTSRTLRLPV